MTTITKEWLQQTIAEFENTRDDIPFGLSDDDAKILIVLKRALVSLDAEPVRYLNKFSGTCVTLEQQSNAADDVAVYMPLYAAPPVQETGIYKDMLNIIGLLENNEWAEHCTSTVLGSLLESEITRLVGKEQPASERERIRREHAEWSDATFGNVGPVGPLKHLSKEALEAAAEPGDLSEWADMQFLLWDGQRRAGISDEQITQAMVEKLAVNKQREWPEPKDGEPRLHIKEQPAPVVPPAIEPDYEVIKGILPTTNPDEYACCIAADMWNACRADMFQGGQPVSNRDELSSPVIPDGYALVPIVPTEDMVINGFESEPDPHFSDEKVWAEYEALSGCRRAARRAELCWAAMIKAAPKQEGNNG
ncbi:DUF550 domain-containing protein [Salmonella enterica subsp. enterica serovar Bovismorbificans]|nr:DUF550 domain-containing protein [Salmonella enterica]EGV4564370.1 DUF550 domain-containing protein [Salmonella enterica subsp. enterica serovar Bovismorbificans]EHI7620573.1 DUF550 domain-containing protein [Salmonella enterica]